MIPNFYWVKHIRCCLISFFVLQAQTLRCPTVYYVYNVWLTYPKQNCSIYYVPRPQPKQRCRDIKSTQIPQSWWKNREVIIRLSPTQQTQVMYHSRPRLDRHDELRYHRQDLSMKAWYHLKRAFKRVVEKLTQRGKANAVNLRFGMVIQHYTTLYNLFMEFYGYVWWFWGWFIVGFTTKNITQLGSSQM